MALERRGRRYAELATLHPWATHRGASRAARFGLSGTTGDAARPPLRAPCAPRRRRAAATAAAAAAATATPQTRTKRRSSGGARALRRSRPVPAATRAAARPSWWCTTWMSRLAARAALLPQARRGCRAQVRCARLAGARYASRQHSGAHLRGGAQARRRAAALRARARRKVARPAQTRGSASRRRCAACCARRGTTTTTLRRCVTRRAWPQADVRAPCARVAALRRHACDLGAPCGCAARCADARARAAALQAAQRCFRCGGSGHRERECTAAPRERPCFLCGACSSGCAAAQRACLA